MPCRLLEDAPPHARRDGVVDDEECPETRIVAMHLGNERAAGAAGGKVLAESGVLGRREVLVHLPRREGKEGLVIGHDDQSVADPSRSRSRTRARQMYVAVAPGVRPIASPISADEKPSAAISATRASAGRSASASRRRTDSLDRTA